MQGPIYLFFFKDNDAGTFYRVENGIVQLGAPRPLEYSPVGWKDTSIVNQRNSTYFALDRSTGAKFEFVEDGATILKYLYYNFGRKKKVSLIIAKQELYFDNTEYGFYYRPFYNGDVDFTTFSHDGPKVSANILEGGIVKLIKAFQNQKYEFDVDVPEMKKIKWDGIKLFDKANYGFFEFPITQVFGDLEHSLPVFFVNNEGASSGLAFGNSPLQNLVGFDLATNNDRWIFNSLLQTTTVRFKGQISLQLTNPAKNYHAYFKKQNGTSYDIVPTVSLGAGVHTFDFDITIPISAGDRIFALAFRQGPNVAIIYKNTTFSASYSSRLATTFVKAVTPEYLLKQLINKISKGAYTVQTDLLAANFNFMLTCGDAIRGLPGSKLKTSLADFFKSIGVQFDIGLGMVAGMLRLEEKVFFVDYTNPIHLGAGSNLKVKHAIDYTFNSIKVGYPEQNYDAALGAANGKLEFNNTYSYTTDIDEITKELNLVSVYRGDCFGAEFTRINFSGKTTTDNDSDNDIWIIHTTKIPIDDPIEGPVYELNRDLNPYVTGVPDPASVFNVYLSPGRCLQRLGRFIHSCFYKMEDSKLVFQTTEKNADLVTTLPASAPVHDNQDLEVSTLLPALFSPVACDVDLPINFDSFDILDQNAVKTFTFDYNGVTYKVIPVKVSVEPYTEDKQVYSLLFAPDNDLTQLIEVYE